MSLFHLIFLSLTICLTLSAHASKNTASKPFRDCKDCPEMVWLPSGSFTMGSAKPDDARISDEAPPHPVTIAYRLAMARHPVTYAQWDACVADGGCRRYRPDDLGWGRGDRPVVMVNWDDAKAYVAWLAQRTKQPYRLPSEAEWEYAARAGTSTSRYWGDEIGSNQANCDGCGSEWDGKMTAPVGSFAPNPWGLHDMLGNVWQWVEDCYREDYRTAPNNGRPVWLFNQGCSTGRVMRGGAWLFKPRFVRAAQRMRNDPLTRYNIIGFRVVRVGQ